jgi:hypothetical protein
MSANASTFQARDVVLAVAFLVAFPLAVNVTGALSSDGIPDRTVPVVDRGTH